MLIRFRLAVYNSRDRHTKSRRGKTVRQTMLSPYTTFKEYKHNEEIVAGRCILIEVYICAMFIFGRLYVGVSVYCNDAFQWYLGGFKL